jgi:hypothetical protein
MQDFFRVAFALLVFCCHAVMATTTIISSPVTSIPPTTTTNAVHFSSNRRIYVQRRWVGNITPSSQCYVGKYGYLGRYTGCIYLCGDDSKTMWRKLTDFANGGITNIVSSDTCGTFWETHTKGKISFGMTSDIFSSAYPIFSPKLLSDEYGFLKYGARASTSSAGCSSNLAVLCMAIIITIIIY